MNRVAVIIFAVALLGRAAAQTPARVLASTRSYSGQFEVHSPLGLGPSARPSVSGDGFISLEPGLLAVTCERIKAALWRALDARPSWRGKVHLTLRPARSAAETVTIVSEKVPGGWTYRVGLPNEMEQDRFVRVIVQVLLMEIANRNAGSRPAEIPSWLAEGLSQELLGLGSSEFLLEPPSRNENGLVLNRIAVDEWRTNLLARAKRTLNARPPLTFEQLSWPGAEQWSGETGDVYRSSAQLFVDELLRLKNGPACLRAMLADLPRRYNWQFAFLDAFQAYFKQTLDVEKWWALQLVEFTGRDLTEMWSPAESWIKLDEILHLPIEVRTGSGELPLRTEVTLQAIIRDWNTAQQAQILPRKLRELDSLRLRVAQDLIALVDDYRQVLGTYLEKRSAPRALTFIKRLGNLIPDRTADDALKQLDALDARRARLRPAPDAAVTTAAPPDPAAVR